MKLKLISDGTLDGTKIVNAETNEIVSNVVNATWEINESFLAKLTITIVNPEIEIQSNFNFKTKEYNKDTGAFEEKSEELYCKITSEGSPANVKCICDDNLIYGIDKIHWNADSANKTLDGKASRFKIIL